MLAIYPLDSKHGGTDIGGQRSPTGRFSNIIYGTGPFGWPQTSISLQGRSTSYVEFPNNGKLDARRSITILAWIFHSGTSGPIVNYNPGPRWGLHFWMTSHRTIFLRFVNRNGGMTTPLVGYNRVPYRAWTYVGGTYDYRTGNAKLWVNGRVVAHKHIGRITLATRRSIRIGAKIGDRRYFRGKVACVQIYSQALNAYQISLARKRCFRGTDLR